MRDLANRMNRGELTQAEFEALRRAANELRRLSRRSAGRAATRCCKLIDQIELAALAADGQSREAAAARATLPASGLAALSRGGRRVLSPTGQSLSESRRASARCAIDFRCRRSARVVDTGASLRI